jgi:hypothetical protein
MSKDHPESQSRRSFLRTTGAAGTAAAAAATVPGVALADTETAEPKKPEGYRLTKHILAYYRSAAS